MYVYICIYREYKKKFFKMEFICYMKNYYNCGNY